MHNIVSAGKALSATQITGRVLPDRSLITLKTDPIHQTMDCQIIEGREFYFLTPQHPKDKKGRPTIKIFQNRSSFSNGFNSSIAFEFYFGQKQPILDRSCLSSYRRLQSRGNLFQFCHTTLSLRSRMGIYWMETMSHYRLMYTYRSEPPRKNGRPSLRFNKR